MSTTAQQEVNTPANVTTGNFVWHELRTTDAKGAEDFYTHVIGWKAKTPAIPEGSLQTFLHRRLGHRRNAGARSADAGCRHEARLGRIHRGQ